MKNPDLYKIKNATIAIVFLLAIYIPFWVGVLQKDRTVSSLEKRSLSVRPPVPKTLTDIQIFPQLFDDYYSDQFGLRDWFASHYKLAKYYIGDSSSEIVTLGKEGWLFLGSLRSTEYDDPIGDYRNINLFTQEELKKFAYYATATQSELKSKGIEYVFVIAPNKATIYGEYLPDYIQKVGEKSAADQLFAYLNENTDVAAVDLRPQLISAKDKHRLYFKTDTHWNHHGANIAQYQIMLKVEGLFPGRLSPRLFPMSTTTKGGGDLANFLGLNIFEEEYPEPIFEDLCQPVRQPIGAQDTQSYTATCEGQDLSVLIFGDSFLNALEPYFARKFGRSTFLYKQLDQEFLRKQIELYQPDVVIEEMVERKLPYVPNSVVEE